MTDEGREEEIPSKDPLVRMAEALEKLASDPEVEIEVGPPICPSCGKLNPVMSLPPQEGAEGRMAELIINGQCGECGKPIYVVIESYSVHNSSLSAINEIQERKGAGFFE